MRLLMLTVAAFAAAPILAQQASLPQLRSSDGKIVTRAQPFQQVDDVGVTIDPRAPVGARSASQAFTLGAAGTFQRVLPANDARLGCVIQNKSSLATAVVRVFLGAVAQATNERSIDLDAGDTFSCTSGSGTVVTDEIALAGSESGARVVVVSQ